MPDSVDCSHLHPILSPLSLKRWAKRNRDAANGRLNPLVRECNRRGSTHRALLHHPQRRKWFDLRKPPRRQRQLRDRRARDRLHLPCSRNHRLPLHPRVRFRAARHHFRDRKRILRVHRRLYPVHARPNRFLARPVQSFRPDRGRCPDPDPGLRDPDRVCTYLQSLSDERTAGESDLWCCGRVVQVQWWVVTFHGGGAGGDGAGAERISELLTSRTSEFAVRSGFFFMLMRVCAMSCERCKIKTIGCNRFGRLICLVTGQCIGETTSAVSIACSFGAVFDPVAGTRYPLYSQSHPLTDW